MEQGQDEEGRISELKLVDIEGNVKPEIEDTKSISIAVSGYIAAGGDGYEVLNCSTKINAKEKVNQ